jgi:fido (protein-threonine AMPylation protein)
MPEDLPIYSDSMLRTRLQFADLERLKGVDTAAVWEKSDTFIEEFEGAVNVRQVRETIQEITKPNLLQAHAMLFSGREDAGVWRHTSIKPLYRGQDCPDPQFIEHSIDNFLTWLTAESVSEIHPIERAALVLTRITDIWPFQFGNLTIALIAANVCLRRAGLTPFFFDPAHAKEFNTTVAQAMAIETQPLVNAIYNIVKREMQSLADR